MTTHHNVYIYTYMLFFTFKEKAFYVIRFLSMTDDMPFFFLDTRVQCVHCLYSYHHWNVPSVLRAD